MNRFLLFAQRLRAGSLGPAQYIFVSVLALRLFALARLTASPFLLPRGGDMYFYNDWALRILRGQMTDHLAFYGLPLYPYLLASLYKFFGYSPFVPGFLQALLEAGTATVIYKIATEIFACTRDDDSEAAVPSSLRPTLNATRAIGIFAAAGWAFFQPAEAFSIILMPTAWLVFVFWFLVWRVVRTTSPIDKICATLFGLLVGVTAMGVATILFILPLLVTAIVLRRGIAREKILALAFLLLGVGAGMSPCWLHNVFVAHDRVLLSAHSGINFWIGNNPIANGYPRFPPGLSAGQAAMLQDSIAVAESAAGHSLKRSEVSAYWSEKAGRFIRANHWAWLRLLTHKITNFWSAFQYDDLSIITNLRAERVILPGLSFGLVAALALPGMILAGQTFRRSRWIIAAIFLHMASLLAVFITERYRLAAVPGLLLFAAFGLWYFWINLSLGKYFAAAVYFALLGLATLAVSQPQRDPSLWALDAYNAGWQALESHNLALAEAKLELARAYVPDNAEINLALGNLWLERQQTARAASFYRAALAIDPRHKAALSNLGVLELENHRATAATDLFRAAIRVRGNEAKSHYLLARALLESGAKNEALSEATIASKLDPRQPEFTALREQLAQSP